MKRAPLDATKTQYPEASNDLGTFIPTQANARFASVNSTYTHQKNFIF